MKTNSASVRFLLLLASFASGAVPAWTQIGGPGPTPTVPVISIRGSGSTPEFCPPNADCVSLGFVLTRTGPGLDRPLTVPLAFGGSATPGLDYKELPESATFQSSQDTLFLFSEPYDDTLVEGTETVIARIVPPPLGANIPYQVNPQQGSATISILDNDSPGNEEAVVRIDTTQQIAEESSIPFRRLALRGRFTISRTGPTNQPLSVFVHLAGSAVAGKDYEPLPWLVRIPAGSRATDLDVIAIPDDIAEPIETVEATLSECPPDTDPPLGIPCYAVNIDPAHASAQVFIRDDGISTASVEITTPKEGTVFGVGVPIMILAVAIDLEGAITDLEFFDGDTKIGESHINFFVQPPPGTPVIHQFDWSGAAPGTHFLNARTEADAAGHVVVSPRVTIIVGADLPVVSIEATVPETTEPSPDTRVRPGVFTLRRTGDTNAPLRVLMHYGGTATPDLDYQAAPTSVLFPAGAASVEILIGALEDNLSEGDETVIGELVVSPLNGLPTYRVDPNANRARIIIHDNNAPTVPIVSIQATRSETSELLCPPNTCTAPVPEPGVFVVTRRANDLSQELFVLVRVGGTATSGLDYEALPESVRIPAGAASVELLVEAGFDELQEGDETVNVELLPDPSLGPIERYRVDPDHAKAQVVIHDRTPPPTLPVVSIVAVDPLAREGANSAGALNTAAFVVRRTGPTNSSLTVPYRIGGMASNGVDYATLQSPILFAPGQRHARLIVTPLDDQEPEPPETVVISLLAPSPANLPPNYSLGTPRRAAALILDNDRPRPPCARLADGLFNLCLPVETNGCFRIEATDDLLGWVPLCTVPATEGAAHFIDPDADTFPRRLYRIALVPCDPE